MILSISMLIMILSILTLINNAGKNHVKDKYDKAQNLLGQLNTINSISDIEKAICILEDLNSNYFMDNKRKCNSYNDIAIAHEKLSYAHSKTGCIFHLSIERKIISFSVNSEDKIGKILPDTIIQCTSIDDYSNWEKARNAYRNSYTFLNGLEHKSESKEFQHQLIKSYRNVCYFFICDYLKHDSEEYLEISKNSIEKALEIVSFGGNYTRVKDLRFKQNFINAMYDNVDLKCD